MKSFTRILLAVVLLAALSLCAQEATNAPAGFEPLPANSPYGAAFVKRNIPYGNEPAHQNFDLMLPAKKSAEPFPLVIWIHGGAWMMGFKEWDNVKYLVAHGYAIASMDYRFTTEAPFPAQIQDCNAAMNFILAHAADYGVSATNFVVGGGSAGGHLALLLGLARNEKDFGADPNLKPRAVLDFFGPADASRMKSDLEAIGSTNGLQLWEDAGTKLFGQPVDTATNEWRIVSPISYVNADNPPVLIVQGGKDNLVPPAQSRRLHEALTKAGVRNQLVIVPPAGHDGPLFSSRFVDAKVIRFLNEVFRKPGAS
jgi:acetyl esterase/lipase